MKNKDNKPHEESNSQSPQNSSRKETIRKLLEGVGSKHVQKTGSILMPLSKKPKN
jgi:hypothetical protein